MDLRLLRKAELHVHLEGSVTPETLREIDPSRTLEEILARYRYDDFMGFLMAYKWVNLHLIQPAHYALIARRLIDSLVAQGVVYAEIIVSVGVLLWRKQEFAPIFDAIAAEAERGPIPVRFSFDAARQFGVELAERVAELAAASRGRGVIGFGLGGDERNHPIENFRHVCTYAKQNGLHLTPHAGEVAGPESVWAALECGAERIGHGIRSIDDPVLVRHLSDLQIPLEVSISSNVCTGAVLSLQEHPVRKLFDAGVPIVLNTDDPPMFHTTLLREYEIAQNVFSFTDDELRHTAAQSLRFAFEPPNETA